MSKGNVMKEKEKFEEVKKEEISREINCLVLEVVFRLKRESPQLLRLLFSASETEKTSITKNSDKKVPDKRHEK
jgi:hypothetical protein